MDGLCQRPLVVGGAAEENSRAQIRVSVEAELTRATRDGRLDRNQLTDLEATDTIAQSLNPRRELVAHNHGDQSRKFLQQRP